MSNSPSGTVTFLFTDIEGSTKRWEAHPSEMQAALQRHDAILRSALEAQGGYVFKTMGDAFYAAFPTPLSALQAALQAQRALQTREWPEEIGSVPVRMALHTGMVESRDGDYFGQPLNRVARLLSAGHGGQTLLSDPTFDLVRDVLPSGVTLLDMGEHRLKDLQRPERIYQLVAPGLVTEFPPLKTLDSRPNNLPEQLNPLIGREREIASVLDLLRKQGTRLVTLTGPGGTGKTRLALQAGAEALDDYPDGVWFVNLAPLSDHNLVVSTIAQTLGVKEAGGTPLIDTLKSYLKEKRLLLVLDNFEQVVQAAAHIPELLRAAPHLKMLITSRERLQTTGEHEYPVPPLQLPDRKQLPSLDRLAQYEAVRLFIERAVALKPEFQVTNENAPAVAEICHRLDGLPLAIELAAARIKILPPQAILSRLESRLKLLTGGGRDLSARQQTLRGAIEWSYDLLSDEEKKLFRRLAVFVGGRTLEAIEAICNAEGDLEIDVLDGVSSLVDKSLLRQEEGVGGEPRYVMLETIHEYAREKLQESGEDAYARDEHLRFFARLAARGEIELRGPNQVQWFASLEAEYHNIRAAMARALERGEARVTAELGWALRELWNSYGHWSEIAPLLLDLLHQPSIDEDLPSKAKALRLAGNIAEHRHDYTTSKAYFEQSISISRQVGDTEGIAYALMRLAWHLITHDEPLKAVPLVEESIRLFVAAGKETRVGQGFIFLGAAAFMQGDYTGARTHMEQSLAIRRRIGDKQGTANTLNNLGEVIECQADYHRARTLYEESLSLWRELGVRSELSMTLHNLGRLESSIGNNEAAVALLTESLRIRRDLGQQQGIAENLIALAGVAARDWPTRAAKLLASAELLLGRIHGKLWPCDSLCRQASRDTVHSQLDEATFQVAWTEGQAMTPEEAIAYALEEPHDG